MIGIAMVIEEEEANRTLDEEMDRTRTPGNVEQKDNLDQHRNARVGVETGGEARNPSVE